MLRPTNYNTHITPATRAAARLKLTFSTCKTLIIVVCFGNIDSLEFIRTQITLHVQICKPTTHFRDALRWNLRHHHHPTCLFIYLFVRLVDLIIRQMKELTVKIICLEAREKCIYFK